ncbi:Swi5-dependent recombination DNA repair protein [Lachnellula suecica]|uniref:Swi5-dependent recombination DNA repair protein n=1 Tax=Lachnellula suecica TaxID=602035 RepID=A0A8T9CHV6_9HELO|nr:Swi5-dependent recombination DNA repair protein [Lachnellula suecica]
MSTPAAKRRRIDAASHTLAKPFRSPFKTPFKSPVKGQQASQENAGISTQSSTAVRSSGSILADKNPNVPFLPSSLATPARAPRSKKTFTSPVQAAALNADPDIAPLLRAQRDLEKQLREVKEELETAEQARKIEADSRKKDPDREIDGELAELIVKWKAASRQAAEELFGQVRDRVNRMGGPRAWKDMQKKQAEFQNNWDQDEPVDDDSDDDGEEAEAKKAAKQDLYAQYDIDAETENEKSQRPKGLGDTGERPGEEDEFTMAMMLRTLNVDLDIIGYDRDQQRWVD